MDIIRQLPDTVANQIAAGEVVQRPASALKELVENAVDAGATEIQIVIKDAGRTLIQVVDNGKGMSHNDARMAFERHATSKIAAAEDLFTLHTMGFRGEALASICAIAQVELRTCQKGESLGTRIVYAGGVKEAQEPCVCTPGCNFMVKNLFYNVPARRKFLKSDSVELGAIMREFERLALVNNHIRLTMDTGTRTIDLRAGSLKQRIGDIWKNSLNMQLLPIEVETSLIKITGFISRPEGARRRNALQYLIVNGRNMRHPYFHKAILSCYEGFIAMDTQPNYFLKFEVDPQTIDVNISPTKSEIKFEHELEIRPILTAAIRSAISKYGAAPSIDFSQDAMQLDPAREGEYISAPDLGVDTTYNPFKTGGSGPASGAFSGGSGGSGGFGGGGFGNGSAAFSRRQSAANWESLYTGFMSDGADSQPQVHVAPAPAPQQALDLGTPQEVAPLCIQCAEKYIVTPDRDGLMVIDQHRAHVRVLYDRYMRESAGHDIQASQRIMFPETLELDPTQTALLDGMKDELTRLGFTLEKEADGRYAITGIPARLHPGAAKEVIIKVVESVSDESSTYGTDAPGQAPDLRARLALLTARAGAIRRGQRLSASEMEHLISELMSLPDPGRTPAGTPIIAHLPAASLASLLP